MNNIDYKDNKENKESKYTDINLDAVFTDYDEDEDAYYYYCECGEQIEIKRESLIGSENVKIVCEQCSLKIRLTNYNHLVYRT